MIRTENRVASKDSGSDKRVASWDFGCKVGFGLRIGLQGRSQALIRGLQVGIRVVR